MSDPFTDVLNATRAAVVGLGILQIMCFVWTGLNAAELRAMDKAVRNNLSVVEHTEELKRMCSEYSRLNGFSSGISHRFDSEGLLHITCFIDGSSHDPFEYDDLKAKLLELKAGKYDDCKASCPTSLR